MPYLPLEDYGLIGDLHTAVLVGANGSIDWFCYPRFDSPSIFGAVLDDAKGGRFQVTSARQDVIHKQLYSPDTNILITRFLSEDGVSEIIDFMPVGTDEEDYHGRLVRIVKSVRGNMSLKMECRPAFNYGRTKHRVEIRCFVLPQ